MVPPTTVRSASPSHVLSHDPLVANILVDGSSNTVIVSITVSAQVPSETI